MHFSLISLVLFSHPSIHSFNKYLLKCLRWLFAIEKARTFTVGDCDPNGYDERETKDANHTQPVPILLNIRTQQSWCRWPRVHLCVPVCVHTPMYIYIFIYLYKHYICIHTIYVIYNICIMHINSNKCICAIFKIEQLYLKVVNAENWFLLLICGFNDFF